MYGPGDVQVERVPDAGIVEPSDALLIITRACISGSNLRSYKPTRPSEKGCRRRGR